MKIAHVSDLHYCTKHLKWVDRAMTEAVDRAIMDQCDAFVISGDCFDHAMPVHTPAVAAFYKQVLRVADHMPVAVLYGTLLHDPVGCLEVLKHVPSKHEILVIDKPGAWVLSDTGWRLFDFDFVRPDKLLLCGLPGLNKADKGIMDTGAAAYVQTVMDNFARIAETARAGGIPSVLMTHGMVVGSVTESNHAMVAPDHEFTEDILFSSGVDAVMIGHVHAFQEFHSDQGQVMAYPGSLARLVFGDHTDKGWLFWDLPPGAPTFERVTLKSRGLVEVVFDGPPDMDELKELATTVGPDDSVKITWTVDQEYAGIVDKAGIEKLFAAAEKTSLHQSLIPIQSVRAEEMLKATSIEEKVKVWLESTGDVEAYEATARRLAQCRLSSVDELLEELT